MATAREHRPWLCRERSGADWAFTMRRAFRNRRKIGRWRITPSDPKRSASFKCWKALLPRCPHLDQTGDANRSNDSSKEQQQNRRDGHRHAIPMTDAFFLLVSQISHRNGFSHKPHVPVRSKPSQKLPLFTQVVSISDDRTKPLRLKGFQAFDSTTPHAWGASRRYRGGSSRSGARSSKRVMFFRNVSGTAPTGPLRCLAMTNSARPSDSFFSSSSSA